MNRYILYYMILLHIRIGCVIFFFCVCGVFDVVITFVLHIDLTCTTFSQAFWNYLYLVASIQLQIEYMIFNRFLNLRHDLFDISNVFEDASYLYQSDFNGWCFESGDKKISEWIRLNLDNFAQLILKRNSKWNEMKSTIILEFRENFYFQTSVSGSKKT